MTAAAQSFRWPTFDGRHCARGGWPPVNQLTVIKASVVSLLVRLLDVAPFSQSARRHSTVNSCCCTCRVPEIDTTAASGLDCSRSAVQIPGRGQFRCHRSKNAVEIQRNFCCMPLLIMQWWLSNKFPSVIGLPSVPAASAPRLLVLFLLLFCRRVYTSTVTPSGHVIVPSDDRVVYTDSRLVVIPRRHGDDSISTPEKNLLVHAVASCSISAATAGCRPKAVRQIHFDRRCAVVSSIGVHDVVRWAPMFEYSFCASLNAIIRTAAPRWSVSRWRRRRQSGKRKSLFVNARGFDNVDGVRRPLGVCHRATRPGDWSYECHSQWGGAGGVKENQYSTSGLKGVQQPSQTSDHTRSLYRHIPAAQRRCRLLSTAGIPRSTDTAKSRGSRAASWTVFLTTISR
jgi:hypothetical protein